MKIEEFNARRWGANLWASYNGQDYYIISVNFPEALLALVPDKDDYDPEEWMWVRCENVGEVKEGAK